MRLLLLALGAIAALVSWAVWASSRDLREPWVVPPMPDPDDDVQPPTPTDPDELAELEAENADLRKAIAAMVTLGQEALGDAEDTGGTQP